MQALPCIQGRSHIWHVLRRTAAVILLAVAVLAGSTIGTVMFFGAASLTSDALAMTLAALLGCLVLASGIAWLAFRALMARWYGWAALATGAATTLTLTVAAELTIFKPLAAPQSLPPLPSSAAYWNLPTGSRIAVLHVPAQGIPKATPLILVHGGPGAFEVTATGAAYYGALAHNGFDVYLYDQIGSGHSARLVDPWEYTVNRHVADLEAIRRQTGAEQVVLLGDSWGATLVANYMAAYPQHVARVIFTSPGAISRADWHGSLTPASRLPAEQQRQSDALFERPRFRAWQILLRRNVQAAYHFVPEAELDGFADTIIASFLDGALCEPAPRARVDLSAGFGFWSMTMTNWDMSERRFDAHTALASNTTPALILRGECDYIPRTVAAAYKKTLPNAILVAVPRAGHLMYYEQPELYLAMVRAFLLDQPLPLAPNTNSVPPLVEDGRWGGQDR